MKTTPLFAVLSAGVLAATFACGQNYQFDVDYFGGGVSALAPGSDDPDGLNLLIGDQFVWTIEANGGAYWEVETAGGFFPLMAFAVDGPGTRTGNYVFTLSYLGSDVFSESASGEVTQEVHLGTNTIHLGQGLQFDRMKLEFELVSAVELEANAVDPLDLQPIATVIQGNLPIFGAPEMNGFSPGIIYVVPEPASLLMGSLGLGVLGVRRRR